jgi:hypothetical protein
MLWGNRVRALQYLNKKLVKETVLCFYVDRTKGNLAVTVNGTQHGFAGVDIDFVKSGPLYLSFHSFAFGN